MKAFIASALIIPAMLFPASVTIVRDGAPLAKIAVGRGATAQVSNAANTLAQYLALATGAKLPVVGEDAVKDDTGIVIQVGPASLPMGKNALPKELDGDGFAIVAHGKDIVIIGPTDWGTEFGVYEFLERFVGVRWLLPGPDGADVPAARTITVPEGTVTDAPVFFSRTASGFRGPLQAEWTRFNRMHGRVNFHHNLRWLFPPETYAKAHPEYYPLKKDKGRYIPKDNNDHYWQPCLTAPGIVDEAVKNINDYFAKNPDATSYSLGMNDNVSFCECDNCHAKITGERNFIGDIDYSDLYYEWCAAVIDGVLKTHPDKWFGCLAYHNVIAPPKRAKVHPRLVPYMTYDRMKWIDPAIEAGGKATTESWARSAATLGWYDYAYGSPYCVPRVYFHQMQDYLSYGKAAGVKSQYAEIYPNWGEGPKPYVMLKLWWDPALDVDKLLKEWYVRCVGEAAAPFLEKYYAIWEAFWTKKIRSSKWFIANGKAQYLNFAGPDYLRDIDTADMLESRKLIDQCLAKCATDKQKARAKLLEAAFRYYEASALSYKFDADMATRSVTTADEALRLVNESERIAGYAALRIRLVNEVFPKDPLLVHPITIAGYRRLAEEEFFGFKSFTRISDWLASDENVRRRAEEIAAKTDIPKYREVLNGMLSFADKVKAILDGSLKPLTKNPSFEDGDGAKAADWSYWTRNPIGKISRVDTPARGGKSALLCDGLEIGCPVQDAPFAGAGTYFGVMWVFAPAGQTSAGQVEIKVEVWGEKKPLTSFSKRVSPEPGKWVMIADGGAVADTVNGEKPVKVRIMPIAHAFNGDGGKVYFDDVGLYKIR